jgi:transcriptional regulator with GAF, ATPase, and Fis domain/tetratricopeptide (TPR) repeat protein
LTDFAGGGLDGTLGLARGNDGSEALTDLAGGRGGSGRLPGTGGGAEAGLLRGTGNLRPGEPGGGGGFFRGSAGLATGAGRSTSGLDGAGDLFAVGFPQPSAMSSIRPLVSSPTRGRPRRAGPSSDMGRRYHASQHCIRVNCVGNYSPTLVAPVDVINGRYQIEQRLGSGADGAVFLATDPIADRRVALKLLEQSPDSSAAARLRAEFRRLSALDHPSLLKVHDLETVDAPVPGFAAGALFFTSDYLDGVDLDGFVRGRPTLAALINALADVAAALDHIHAAGLLHCDIKPDNIRVTDPRTGAATLLDLGLSVAAGLTGAARGTPAYMDRAALAGRPDAQSDLHALGAAFYAALSGAPPFPHRDLGQLIGALDRGGATPLRTWRPDLDRGFAAVIDRLLVAGERPSSARVLLDILGQLGEASGISTPALERAAGGRTLATPRLVGREPAIVAAKVAVSAAIAGAAAPLIRLVGEPGSGRGAVADEIANRAQLEASAESGATIDVIRGDESALMTALAGEPEADAGWTDAADYRAPLRAAADRAIAELRRRAERRPVALVLAAEPARDLRAAELIRALAAGAVAVGGRFAVIAAIEPGDAAPGDRATDIEIAPLPPDQVTALVRSMVSEPIDPAWSEELGAACGGRPQLVIEAVRAAAGRAEAVDTVAVSDLVSGESRAAVAALLEQRASRLPASLRDLFGAVAVLGGDAAAADVAALLERDEEAVFADAASLAAESLCAVDGERLRASSPAHVDAGDAALPPRRRRALHRRALELAGDAARPERRAAHLLVAGRADEAADAALEAALELAARSELERAAHFAREAVARAQGKTASRAELALAEIALALGRYDEAIRAAERVSRSRNAERRRRGHIALARARQKSGDLDGAETALAALAGKFPDDSTARGAYGRLLVSRGRIDDAAEAAGDIEPIIERGLGNPGDPLRVEAGGLVELYRGDAAAADRAFAAIARRAERIGDGALAGRAAALRGLAAHHAGDIVRAAQLYGEAAAAATAAGEIHAAAVSQINQATAHSERGRAAKALAALDAALVSLRRLGQVSELPAALFNRGHALLCLGELDAARRGADQALALARELGTPQMEIYAQLLIGDVSRRQGELDAAAAAYRAALEVAGSAGADRDMLAVRLASAELLAERGDSRAVAELDDAAALIATGEERARWLLARARVSLRFGEPADQITGQLEEARDAASTTGREDLAWRLASLIARLASAAGDRERARDYTRRARSELEGLLADTPESRRAGARSDPDAIALASLEDELEMSRTVAVIEASGPTEELAALRRLLGLSRRLNSELRLRPLLDQVIDTAIDLTGAERGFLLMRRPGAAGSVEVAVARNIEHEELRGPDQELSRSIAERAARTGEVVLTVDAAFDERFGAAESVAAMQLRSVLAVPLRRRSELCGTIYVDHRFQAGAFDDQAVRLCRELADIAAVAIGNARLAEDNRRRQESITDLNRLLEKELGEREKELATVRSQLAPGVAGLRAPEIVGRSAPMLELQELLERAAASDLSVVITGESGTGKELVARALHRLGSRANGPFVAVNCGAVPEPLLESELFGHVRGAFTGAERTRRGHFEVADGGTLFLDEIADTSPAMQAKLLRVLQEGEIRRLGDEATRQVDVRVVAASNRTLAELVAAGHFRQDLYYRLNVLSLVVPPLRERIEDVPELAAHILERQGGHTTLSRAALRMLCRYPWPGNVRELENELARAAALAEGAITPEHLSERVRESAGEIASSAATDDLDLRTHVESLERQLIAAALERTGGNQSKAAKILGLSRYGLQKKLKRYQM